MKNYMYKNYYDENNLPRLRDFFALAPALSGPHSRAATVSPPEMSGLPYRSLACRKKPLLSPFSEEGKTKKNTIKKYELNQNQSN